MFFSLFFCRFVRAAPLILFYGLVMSLLLTSAARAEPRLSASSSSLPPSSAATAPVILVWGDSLCAGYGITAQAAWPSLLREKLAAEGFPHHLVNGCVSGETTAGGLSRLPKALQEHAPAILILSLGANDGLRGLPLSQMETHLTQMIKKAKTAKAQVLLVGMMLPPNYGPAYTRRFVRTFPTLAKVHETAFLPFLLEGFAQDRTAFQDDGLHPTADSQALILANVWPVLLPLLRP